MMKYNHWLPKLLTKLIPGQIVNAIVLFKRVYFLKEKSQVDEKLIRHEKKHIDQQEKDGLKFYLIYFVEYLANRSKGMSHFESYKNISYEIEARKAETKSM
jgi:hypothetical protein